MTLRALHSTGLPFHGAAPADEPPVWWDFPVRHAQCLQNVDSCGSMAGGGSHCGLTEASPAGILVGDLLNQAIWEGRASVFIVSCLLKPGLVHFLDLGDWVVSYGG